MRQLRLPHITATTVKEQIAQIISYLRYLCTTLQREETTTLVNEVAQTEAADGVAFSHVNGWIIKRYSSGIAECWCRKTQHVRITTRKQHYTDSGYYYVGDCEFEEFPFMFKEIPQCVAYVDCQREENIPLFISNTTPVTRGSPGHHIVVSPVSQTVSCAVNYHAIGRWK